MSIWESIIGIFANRKEKKIERCRRQIRNPKAVKEDRLYALEYFANFKDPAIAIPSLLNRFEYSLEHGINDAREKEIAARGIEQHGEAAVSYIVTHLKATTRIAWPIKVLSKLTEPAKMADILIECLNFEDISFDQALVDKNYDILCYLADYKHPRMTEKLSHFLKDPDERVRFAAAEALVQTQESEVASMLEPFITDDSAENRRLRAITIDAFLRNKWLVNDPQQFGEQPIVDGIFVSKQGHLEKRF